jgi:hypothetical protein
MGSSVSESVRRQAPGVPISKKNRAARRGARVFGGREGIPVSQLLDGKLSYDFVSEVGLAVAGLKQIPFGLHACSDMCLESKHSSSADRSLRRDRLSHPDCRATVAPVRIFMVPIGCSAVLRRVRIACGFSSSRFRFSRSAIPTSLCMPICLGGWRSARLDGLLEPIERAGADIAVHDTKRAKNQGGGPLSGTSPGQPHCPSDVGIELNG